MSNQTNKYNMNNFMNNLNKIGLGLMMYVGVFSMTGCDKGEDPIGPKVVNNKTVEIKMMEDYTAIYPIAEKMPQYKTNPKIDTLFLYDTGERVITGQNMNKQVGVFNQVDSTMKVYGGVARFAKNSRVINGTATMSTETAAIAQKLGMKFQAIQIVDVAQNQR